MIDESDKSLFRLTVDRQKLVDKDNSNENKSLKDLEKDDRTLNILCGIIVILIFVIITLTVYFCVFYKIRDMFLPGF